ncbi:MAG: hypothetical protein AAF750_08900 [Planctomycetota bacterium]
MKTCQMFVAVMIGLAGCSPEAEQVSAVVPDPELVAVRQAFTAYKTAILNDDGDAAYALVDQNTRDWYAASLDRALTWDRQRVMQLGIMDKLQVFTIRHRIPRDELLQMTAESLFTHATDQGWVGKNSVSGLELGSIQVDGDFATGGIRNKGQDTPLKFHFYKEYGDWRIDLTENNKLADTALGLQVQKSGRTEMDYIFRVLEATSGRAVTADVWTPPLE